MKKSSGKGAGKSSKEVSGKKVEAKESMKEERAEYMGKGKKGKPCH